MNRQICYNQLYLECDGSDILVQNFDCVFFNLLFVSMSQAGYTYKNFLTFIQSIFDVLFLGVRNDKMVFLEVLESISLRCFFFEVLRVFLDVRRNFQDHALPLRLGYICLLILR